MSKVSINYFCRSIGLLLILLSFFTVPASAEDAKDPAEICTPERLAVGVLSRPSAADLALAVQAAHADIQAAPCVAALLLGRNQPGDAHRALYLLERFLRQDTTQSPSDAVQLLALLARERARRPEKIRKNAPVFGINNKEINALRQELAEMRKEREVLRHEILELRRKLKAITSIEKSMDERKNH